MKALRLLVIEFLLTYAVLAFGSAPTVPLTINLHAASPVLFMTPTNQSTEKDMLRATSIVPTTLTATFINTGNTPLKLDTYLLPVQLLYLQTNGRDTPVATMLEADRLRTLPHTLEAADYPVLPPGGTWTTSLRLPGAFGAFNYTFPGPGTYRLRLLYGEKLPQLCQMAPRENNPLTEGCFNGAVASNEVEIRVVTAGAAVDGVQMALTCDPAAVPESGVFTLTGYLRNTTDAPLNVPAWNLSALELTIAEENSPAQPLTELQTPTLLTAPGSSVTLAAGEIRAFPLEGHYCSDQIVGDHQQQHGRLVITDALGGIYDREVAGSTGHFYATAGAAGVKPAAASCAVTWNPTDYRRQLLLRRRADFRLTLLRANQDPPTIPLLQIYTPPLTAERGTLQAAPGIVHISEDDAARLIDRVASEGVLRDAQPAGNEVSGYLLDIVIGRRELHWQIPLGKDITTYTRLLQLQADMPLAAQPAMAQVMAALESECAQWQGEAALGTRITTVTPAGTLENVVKHLERIAGSPNLSLCCDDAVAKFPMPGIPIRQLTVFESLRMLAPLANGIITIQGNHVTLKVQDIRGMKAQNNNTRQP